MNATTTTNPSSDASAQSELDRKRNTLRGGAGWFFWIAALSVINSIIGFFQGSWGFIFGLGMTQAVDGVLSEAGSGTRAVGLLVNCGLAAVFVFFGHHARKAAKWAFLVGMSVYALDGLLFLLVGDWLGLAFHAFALFMIGRGFATIDRVRELETRQKQGLLGEQPKAA